MKKVLNSLVFPLFMLLFVSSLTVISFATYPYYIQVGADVFTSTRLFYCNVTDGQGGNGEINSYVYDNESDVYLTVYNSEYNGYISTNSHILFISRNSFKVHMVVNTSDNSRYSSMIPQLLNSTFDSAYGLYVCSWWPPDPDWVEFLYDQQVEPFQTDAHSQGLYNALSYFNENIDVPASGESGESGSGNSSEVESSGDNNGDGNGDFGNGSTGSGDIVDDGHDLDDESVDTLLAKLFEKLLEPLLKAIVRYLERIDNLI